MSPLIKHFSIALLLAVAPLPHALFSQSAPGAAASKAAKGARRPEVPKPDRADLSYGPFANNKLDLWLAKSERPAPLAVYIHGGGFVSGDKSGISPQLLRRYLDAGVSVAAINYRFRTEIPIQEVLRDSARAIQFLRSKAVEFHLDKTRVAAFGGSAGAGTSLWLAFHDDLADSKNPDPVLRESTRISAAVASSTQATYDILRWKEVLGAEAEAHAEPASESFGFYGLKSSAEMESPKGRKIRADVDMLGLITKDDAPVLLISTSAHDAMANRGDVLHSAKHAVAVQKRCNEVGVPAILKIVADLRAGDDSGVQPVDFVLKYLGVKP